MQTELLEPRPYFLRKQGGIGIGRLRFGVHATSLATGYSFIKPLRGLTSAFTVPCWAFPKFPSAIPSAVVPVAIPVALSVVVEVVLPVAVPIALGIACPVAVPIALPVAVPVAPPVALPVALSVAAGVAVLVAPTLALAVVFQIARRAASRVALRVALSIACPIEGTDMDRVALNSECRYQRCQTRAAAADAEFPGVQISGFWSLTSALSGLGLRLLSSEFFLAEYLAGEDE